MSRDSEAICSPASTALLGCLMDGDQQQLTSVRVRRRKAFAVSLTLQLAVVAMIIIVPLFATGQRPLLTILTPAPRFYGATRGVPASSPGHEADAHPTSPSHRILRFVSAPPRIWKAAITSDTLDSPSPTCERCGNGHPTGPGTGPGWPDQIPGLPESDRRSVPMPPVPRAPKPPVMIHRSRIDPAMLIHRVEPVYPPLARMTRREGRVELRAVIGADGSIVSLQVVAGDPLFIAASTAAVMQWRYRPTTLNGQPVEVDTFVTVVFTLNR
ncbi:MAG TPA: energy transducer TonB [Candidatus Dormibacteraeota bacterium]|nr:energy transducer TonB [Candidatus Dormibacteraeota bacterium]